MNPTPENPTKRKGSQDAAPEPASPPWHALSIEDTVSRLQSSPSGLTQAEADRRLCEHGVNELQAAQAVSAWTLLASQFKNVLIVSLLIATVLSLLLGEEVEAIAIAVIVLFAVILGFFQEYRAERAIEALREMAAPSAKVIRDGEEIEAPARQLVPGDVILLRAGDRVPGDARLLEAVNLKVDEAALTGESVSVEKTAAPLADAEPALGDRTSMTYAGTTATYGRGRGIIVGTGMNTEFGRIARMLQTVETGKTPLQENLDKVGTVLATAALGIVIAIVALGIFRGQPFFEMVIFGIALAVAVVPEALPAVVTISLAIGVKRMVRRHALMRRLAAVETLGTTSFICSDNTGTLTKNEMTARKIFAAGETFGISGAGYEPRGAFLRGGSAVEPPEAFVKLLSAATLASDAHVVRKEPEGRWHVRGDPTEGAMVVAAAKAGLEKTDLDARCPRVSEIPFTSERKRMTTIHESPEGPVACSKGASEIILESCTRWLAAEGVRELDARGREAILQEGRQMAREGLRVLAIASKAGAGPEDAENEMTFLGLVGMSDPPRPEARAAIETCERAGIKPVVITGDHPLTAEAVAHELGLLKTGRLMTGPELEAMTDEEFERIVEDVEVYARVSPAHKLRVVTALQARGHVVAMTGDGVNDAPALKKAEIGIAMGISGTDVTKEAAAMTLIDDNFASIVAAVEEGRGIFGNIKKYLMYLLSSNIGEAGLMAGAAIAGLPLPLTAVQILYVNLATDGLPALALAVDPPEPDLMSRKPRRPRAGIFTRPIVALMMIGGLWSTLVNLGLFVWALESGRGLREAMTMTFVSLVLIQFFKAYSFRSDRHSIVNRPFANKWLNLAIIWEIALLCVIVYLPVLHEPVGTFSLPVEDWAIVTGISATVIPLLEAGKWMVRRGWLGEVH